VRIYLILITIIYLIAIIYLILIINLSDCENLSDIRNQYLSDYENISNCDNDIDILNNCQESQYEILKNYENDVDMLNTDKKTESYMVLLYNGEILKCSYDVKKTLGEIMKIICKSRNINHENFVATDSNGKLLDMNKPLDLSVTQVMFYEKTLKEWTKNTENYYWNNQNYKQADKNHVTLEDKTNEIYNIMKEDPNDIIIDPDYNPDTTEMIEDNSIIELDKIRRNYKTFAEKIEKLEKKTIYEDNLLSIIKWDNNIVKTCFPYSIIRNLKKRIIGKMDLYEAKRNI